MRPAPYSTDFGVNGYTYGDTQTAAVPHGVGFVWATVLWEVTWELIDRYGFDADLSNASGTAGNQVALSVVTEGLKLQPCSPGFVDGRDAILAADASLYPDGCTPGRGVHYEALWAAFARRGLGASASQGSPATNEDNVEAFDLPLAVPVANISPSSISAMVAPGADTTATLIIVNDAPAGSAELAYSVSVENLSQPLAAKNEVAAPSRFARESTPVTGRLSTRLPAKGAPEAEGTAPARLTGGPDPFGYVFADSDEPGGPAVAFEDISATGTPITTWTAVSTSYAAGDEGYADVDLPFAFPFYGVDHPTARVYTNGFLTFTGFSGTSFTNGSIPSAEAPNAIIAPFWDDLDLSSGGTVYTGSLPDGRFVVQYQGVRRYSTSGHGDLRGAPVARRDDRGAVRSDERSSDERDGGDRGRRGHGGAGGGAGRGVCGLGQGGAVCADGGVAHGGARQRQHCPWRLC